MQINTEAKPFDTINVTPMLDLAYVLLVVFILMTTASVQGLTISMPKPSNKPSTEKHDLRIVQVMPGGQLLLNGVGLSIEELEAQLLAAKAADAQMSVAIKGHAKAQYASIVAVVDLCNKLQVNMGLITAKIGS
ncbi:ExbD/TolR family protein [Roseateles toxinivorans]|uniref:Outer membrane transport energization protein ExbD n=1 Tax=Roseateles toxinivorans TaxID=270368 RepID=A0A4R6QK22_9BURK|nr:biopolymer transporter ExbD [Roseateles toxinivorans]TDP64086.1 outer membrane transport energization protein ExbD [Roseateles toxinivorans]